MTFLLIGSLILHGISILAIIILYLRQNQYTQSEKTMQKLQREMEEVLQGFLLEIQEENKELATTINSLQGRGHQQEKKLKQKQKEEGSHIHFNNVPSKTAEKVKVLPLKYSAKKAYQMVNNQIKANQTIPYEPPFVDVKDQLDLSSSIEEDKDGMNTFKAVFDSQMAQQVVKSTEERAIEMKKDGYTIGEIAKSLGKGKTEIELLLKFQP